MEALAAAAAQMVENSARFRKSKEKRWNIWPGGGLTDQLVPSERPQRGALGSAPRPLIADSPQQEVIKDRLAHLDPDSEEGNQSK